MERKTALEFDTIIASKPFCLPEFGVERCLGRVSIF